MLWFQPWSSPGSQLTFPETLTHELSDALASLWSELDPPGIQNVPRRPSCNLSFFCLVSITAVNYQNLFWQKSGVYRSNNLEMFELSDGWIVYVCSWGQNSSGVILSMWLRLVLQKTPGPISCHFMSHVPWTEKRNAKMLAITLGWAMGPMHPVWQGVNY